MRTLKIRDVMTENVYTLSRSDSAVTAYDAMSERKFRHIPITDGDEVVGLLSERDLLRYALANTAELPLSAQRHYLERLRVDELMTAVPYTVESDSDASEAGRMLLEYKISCLPVVEGDRLVGVVTEADFVRHVVEAQEKS